MTAAPARTLSISLPLPPPSSPHCVGNIAANEKHGFPGLCLEDSPLGVRFTDLNSVFPAGVTTAATFSSELTYKRGKAMGEEFKSKGVNVALGPGMNMHRAAAAGRNWEMAGADPYLSGEAAYLTTKGIQDAGVQACAKHYIANDQEINRSEWSGRAVDWRTDPFLQTPTALTLTPAPSVKSTSIRSCVPFKPTWPVSCAPTTSSTTRGHARTATY